MSTQAGSAPSPTVRVLISAAATLAGLAVVALIVFFAFFNEEGSPYRVRAIFDDAANVTPGEQVKVAGVPVGSIEAITPTPEAKAAVVFTVSRAGFQDFRADASCTIRPESLLGEKYVDCRPTQQRAEGAPLPPPLPVIEEGREGAGERLLAVRNTSSPVDPDIVTDINHLPERERLRIILNELGAGLEGRGSDLHEVILRANPALRETNRVLQILANENSVLVKLAVDSDQTLAPLAAVRKQFADSFVQQGTVAAASARHEAALAQNFADFPAFLERLGPAMERIGRFGAETTPVMRELGVAAPSIDRLFAALPAFSRKSTPYFESFGRFAQTAGPDFKATEPLLERLEALGAQAKPFGQSFGSLLSNLRNTGGIERLMDFIFLVAGATNGYNALGHFLRADLISGSCVKYFTQINHGCSANFVEESATKASAAARGGEGASAQLTLARLRAELAGASAAQAGAGAAAGSGAAGGHGGGGAGGQSATRGAQQMLLNYLLGE
ncbi:MAG: MCE family protein [Acidobacteriota bacterium]|nr:MCE family protein [Acidobacteriota bacterium]